MQSPPLPSSRTFITQLIEALASRTSPVPEDEISGSDNVLVNAPETTKKQLLALQVLFPNELLPALDLIDRGLVTRLIIDPPPNTHIDDAPTDKGHVDSTTHPAQANINTAVPTLVGDAEAEIPPPAPIARTNPSPNPTSEWNFPTYYVRSAQHRSSRTASSYDSTTFYQVRLLAWTCSCPAFAFAAFPAANPDAPVQTTLTATEQTAQADKWAKRDDWVFGGVSLGEAASPVCKHLLACVLVERCDRLFGRLVEERRVDVHEAAGWAAGWGD